MFVSDAISRKIVVFKDLQGDLRSCSGVSFASLISYITEVFVGKCVIKVTYYHVKFGEVAIKDESNYTTYRFQLYY